MFDTLGAMPTITISWAGSPTRRSLDRAVAERISVAAQEALRRSETAGSVAVELEESNPSPP